MFKLCNNMNYNFSFPHQVMKYDILPEDIQAMLTAADRQLEMAYAPYSNFHVGAAALLYNGAIYTGCNQENASYPLCICAERVALYNVGTQIKGFSIKALAITAHNPKKALDRPCVPCGACRQVIQEFEQRQKKPITLYLTSKNLDVVQVDGITALLPDSFSIDDLI